MAGHPPNGHRRLRAAARFEVDVAIVGGCGHVGLPLGIALADRGLRVVLYDINETTVQLVNQGVMPFAEEGAETILKRVLHRGLLRATTSQAEIGSAEYVVVVIGTAIDAHLNPDLRGVQEAIARLEPALVDGQLLVLRSTVCPGVTANVERLLQGRGRRVDVAYCPERIVEGRAIAEFSALPQIVSARTTQVRERAAKLFYRLTDEIVEVLPEEAELAKLFSNAWRYIKFAAANQFFMMAQDLGLDFERIRHAVTWHYPRAADMPGAGFTAGPCLLKDTLQLAAFSHNNLLLGHAAMMINEGLPAYLVGRLEERYDLSTMTVGILGMSYKPGSDDTRSSLSYKLKRLLRFTGARVLCSDPYVTTDRELIPLTMVLSEADLLIIGTPHRDYASLKTTVPIVDIFNLDGKGIALGSDAATVPLHPQENAPEAAVGQG